MLKKIMKTFEKLFVAIAFAEEGEFDTAREILREKREIPTKRIRPEQRNRAQMRA